MDSARAVSFSHQVRNTKRVEEDGNIGENDGSDDDIKTSVTSVTAFTGDESRNELG